jgi:3-deoxy-D-arabino-heptulosonate 7-phosphate (DAHP) synthase class II/chorismate-pyruvate lyase
VTLTHSVPEPPSGTTLGGSGFRRNRDEIGQFHDPLTRMLLAGDGFTMPVLEAILGAELDVRVLRQDDIEAGRLPGAVTDALGVSDTDRVIVRRSCLVDADMVTVSVNHVVTVRGPSTAWGVDDVRIPIGYSLVSRQAPQRRQILRVGLTRWPDGRLCAAKAYVIVLDDRPLCYIREAFNPSVIPPDHVDPAGCELDWADEPRALTPAPIDLTQAPSVTAAGGARRLRTLPPLIRPDESDALAGHLAHAADGRTFVLHLAERAGRDAGFGTRAIDARRALAHAAAAVLTHGLGTPVVPVDRLPAAAPDELLEAYFVAAATVNYLRVCDVSPAASADLLRRAAQRSPQQSARELLREVAGLLPIAATAPADSHEVYSSLARPHVSRESLLPYGSALTRRGADGRWWDCSTELLWISEASGERAQGHLRFAAQVANPIAVELGPTATIADIESLCCALNPDKTAGRLALAPRPGPRPVGDPLEALFDAAAALGAPVCWICSPVSPQTRGIDDVVAEIRAFQRACRETGVVMAGLHVEYAPDGPLDPVTVLSALPALLAEVRIR